jgi:hypothetical protein
VILAKVYGFDDHECLGVTFSLPAGAEIKFGADVGAPGGLREAQALTGIRRSDRSSGWVKPIWSGRGRRVVLESRQGTGRSRGAKVPRWTACQILRSKQRVDLVARSCLDRTSGVKPGKTGLDATNRTG